MEDSSPSSLPLDKEPRRIEGMFDAIAGRYDFLNGVLSVGLDRWWRARAVPAAPPLWLLDICTGTADLALTVARRYPHTRTVGVDFAAEMLNHGQHKVRDRGEGRRVTLIRGDATRVPVASDRFEGAMIAFGIRNVAEPEEALREIRRALRPGGRLVILEFGTPRPRLVRAAYLWYFRRVLPVIGRLVSRHDSAYRYLPASVGTFHEPATFCQILEDAGFSSVRGVPLTGGVVYLYTGQK